MDDGTGLVYFNTRFMDPLIGRFISPDPIKDGINWFVYCRNNPLRYVDPNGLIAVDIDGNPISYDDDSEEDKGPTSDDVQGDEGSEGEDYLDEEDDPAFLYKEHNKNKRPSNKPKHDKGKKRKKRDREGEKGDKSRRPNRKRPNKWTGPWPPKDDKKTEYLPGAKEFAKVAVTVICVIGWVVYSIVVGG